MLALERVTNSEKKHLCQCFRIAKVVRIVLLGLIGFKNSFSCSTGSKLSAVICVGLESNSNASFYLLLNRWKFIEMTRLRLRQKAWQHWEFSVQMIFKTFSSFCQKCVDFHDTCSVIDSNTEKLLFHYFWNAEFFLVRPGSDTCQAKKLVSNLQLCSYCSDVALEFTKFTITCTQLGLNFKSKKIVILNR